MAVEIFKVTRQGGMGVQFEGRDGMGFLDPNGLKNRQIAAIIGKRLAAYVRCEVGSGMAEVLGEATDEEVAAFEGRSGEDEGGEEGPAPFKFPGA
ncbi:MAG TPA: hypothetical protein VM008_09265 [Phycisphaerae bacterium]|nr:hypothetical protein [Phycisphaerae bacterium]